MKRRDTGIRNHTAREAIELVLGEKVRILTAPQIASTWFGHTRHPLRSAMTCLRSLATQSIVRLDSAMLHPELELSVPLLTWVPGDPSPDFGRIAWLASSRFSKPPRRTTIVRPGSRITAHKGCRRLRSTEIQHDVMVAEIFLRTIERHPARFNRWLHEDSFGTRFDTDEKRPDAILVGENATTYIECAGSYSKAKLQAIHAAFEHIPYELY